MRRGQTAELLERIPRWYKIRLAGGAEGYISKSWSIVLPDDGVKAAALTDKAEDELRLHFFKCRVWQLHPDRDARARARGRSLADCGASAEGKGEHALETGELSQRIGAILAGRAPDVVISHGDPDHYNLLPELFDKTKVNAIWQGGDGQELRPEPAPLGRPQEGRGRETPRRFFRRAGTMTASRSKTGCNAARPMSTS